jgi:uncharacterized protein (UPF0332 family)
MNLNFRRCLEQNKIHISQGIETAALRELEAGKKDLASAQRDFGVGDYKWSTTQAYYAMFHAGRALLYSEGYKERSHYCLLVALEGLFVETGKLSDASLNCLTKARRLREAADYNLEYSKETAEIILEGAGQFIKETEEILSV